MNEKRPIASVEAEASLLGGLLLANRQIDAIADILAPEDFAEARHGLIFAAIVKDAALGRSVTSISIKPALEAEDWKDLGGIKHYLSQLCGSSAAMVGARDLALQIKDLARRRRMVEAMNEAIERARDTEQPLVEIIAEADGSLAEAAMQSGEGIFQGSAGDCINAVIDAFDEPKGRVLSGIETIDGVLGPLRRGNLIIKGGRPGMGKTAEALCYGTGAALNGHGTLFVSLEMDREELGERLVASWLHGGPVGVPYGAIENGDLSAKQRGEVIRAQDEIAQLPLHVVDVGGLTVGRLSMMVRRWKRRMAAMGQDLELVVVDYLQLLHADRRMNSRYDEVSEISRRLKQMAKEHGVAIVALAQLSRAVETRHDKRPLLSDLKESGQIEQDADAVMFLYREEYYLKQAEPDKHHPDRFAWDDAIAAAKDRIEFIVAKRRRAPTGNATGEFIGAYQVVR